MPALRALAPDGSAVEGFRFDGADRHLRRRQAGRRGHPRRARAAADRRPAMARAGGLLRREPPGRLHAHLSALRRRASTSSRMESNSWIVPRRPLRHSRRLRAGRRAADHGDVACSASRASVSLCSTAAADLARLPVPRGADPLRRLGRARPAGRADVPLAAGRAVDARHSRKRSTATTALRRAGTCIRRSRLGARRRGGGARGVGALPLALQGRSAAPDRDGGVRS